MSATANAEFDVGELFETPRGTAEINRISYSTVNGLSTWQYEVKYEDGGTETVLEGDLLERVSTRWQRR